MAREQIRDTLRVFIVPNEILDQADLDIYEKMAYIVLRSYANSQTDTAFPSYKTIAQKGSMSRPKAIQAVAALIEKGLVVKEARYKVKNRTIIENDNNLYTIYRPAEVVNKVNHLVNDVNHPGKQDLLPLVNDVYHPSKQRLPKQKNLTKENLTKENNNNNAVENNVVVESDNPILKFCLQKQIQVNQTTITKWLELADEETIIQAIEETLKKPSIQSVVGYVTNMLKKGFTPSISTNSTNGIKEDKLPASVQEQLEREKQQEQNQQLEKEKSKGTILDDPELAELYHQLRNKTKG